MAPPEGGQPPRALARPSRASPDADGGQQCESGQDGRAQARPSLREHDLDAQAGEVRDCEQRGQPHEHPPLGVTPAAVCAQGGNDSDRTDHTMQAASTKAPPR